MTGKQLKELVAQFPDEGIVQVMCDGFWEPILDDELRVLTDQLDGREEDY